MKAQILITVLLALSLGACGSKDKKADGEAQTEVESTTEKAKAKAEDAVKSAKAAAAGDITCTLGGDTRTIAVKTEGEGCEVIYTKFNEPASIASGSKGSEHCTTVANRVRDNLQNAGFKCE